MSMSMNKDKVRKAVGEIMVCLDHIQAQNDQIKSICEAVPEVEAALLKRTAKAIQKDNRQKELEKTEAFLNLLQGL